MLRSTLLPVVVLLCSPLWAQQEVQFTQDNGDCTGAIYITDSIYRTEQAVRGFGNKLEIKENPSEDLQWFEREHHTTWYKFRVPVKCNLTFDIQPMDLSDDIDFLLFEGAIPGICDKVASKQVTPLRSNISRNDPSVNSQCGLSKTAENDYVRSGVGASYSRSIDVEEGQLFYLVIDHQDRPRSGYTINFHYDPPPPPPPVEKEKAQQQLVINIVDAKSGKPVDANVTVDGMRFDEVVEAKGKSSYEYSMDVYRNLKIGCTRKGYMFTTVRVKGSTDETVTVEIPLTPISVGEKVVLDDIRFVGNEDKVMRQSEASLLLLLRFMQENSNVRIVVQGHVNGPTYKNKKEFIDLSTARAKTVYDFLLVNDIEPDRISYEGIGNAEMIYPEPKNRDQSEANRRVEVKIL
jgi:flagellar motor protein MotB